MRYSPNPDELICCNVPSVPQANTNTIYMNLAKRANSYICVRCLCRQFSLSFRYRNNDISRSFAHSIDLPHETSKDNEDPESTSEANGQGRVEGRMSERLKQMTDEMIERDGRGTKRAIEEGGFSEELKKKLEARLQESSFRSENAAAFAQANLPVRSKFSHQIARSWGLHTSSLALAEEPTVLPPPSLGQAPNGSKMLPCVCSTMLTNPSAVPVLQRFLRPADRQPALTCA